MSRIFDQLSGLSISCVPNIRSVVLVYRSVMSRIFDQLYWFIDQLCPEYSISCTGLSISRVPDIRSVALIYRSVVYLIFDQLHVSLIFDQLY